MTPAPSEVLRDGLWRRNPLLVRLLGLCPLLAVSYQLVNGIAIALTLLLVMIWTSLIVSATRDLIPPAVRLLAYLMVIATGVTLAQLAMQAWSYALAETLGIYVPVIAACCLVVSRAEEFACRHGVAACAIDALAHGGGAALVIVPFAALRELLAYGTLLRDSHLLFPTLPETAAMTVLPGYTGLTLAALPAGALIGLGLLAAVRNAIDARRHIGAPQAHEQDEAHGDLRAA